jgi:uncharacterized membrane protein YcaP (DUF421 family)
MGQFFTAVDWVGVFTPQAPFVETFVRGTVLYLGLLVLLRLTPAREAGSVGTPDLLVMVLLADVAQNAMAGPHHAVGDGLALIATILVWSVALDWAGYRWPFVHRLLRTPPVRLVREGHILPANLRRELITRDELMAELRKHGVEDVAEVKGAWIEDDGRISLVRRRGRSGTSNSRRSLPAASATEERDSARRLTNEPVRGGSSSAVSESRQWLSGCVAVTQMHGKGTFYDPRMNDPQRFPLAVKSGAWNTRSTPDLVTSKLAALHYYQLSIPAPTPPRDSFDATAAGRGKTLFESKARCATCHVPPLYTEPGWAMHTAREIGIDQFQAGRSPEQKFYRTTPLKGLFARAKGGFYHDGRFEDYNAVVTHYNRVHELSLSAQETADLVEFLKSL